MPLGPRDLEDDIAHSHDEAVAMGFLLEHSPRVTHVERLPDSDRVIVWGHIVCEWCRLCETQGDMRGETNPSKIVPWTPDPLYPDPDLQLIADIEHEFPRTRKPEWEGIKRFSFDDGSWP